MKNSVLKTRWILILGLALSFSAGYPAYAQENVQPDNTDSTEADNKAAIPQKPTQSTPQNTESEIPQTTKAPGNYNPTEEISDDLSVSYPVDI